MKMSKRSHLYQSFTFTELNNYTYQTLAHEGFPGHLYQNLYLKNF